MTTAPTAVGILPARGDDLPAVMSMERSGFAPEQQWSERSWQGEFLGEGRTVLIARAHRPVGVISFQTIGELADLHRLVVVDDYRRHGVGRELATAGLTAVRHLGARAAILEVDYHNEPAIALYQAIGFEQLTVRTDYYGLGRHGLIMKLYDLDEWPPLVPEAHP